jgi:diguanylate cyclase (GGDEF)-like protein
MRLLIVAMREEDAAMLLNNLNSRMEGEIERADILLSLHFEMSHFTDSHYDVVMLLDINRFVAASIISQIRKEDGTRHTAVICLAPSNETYNEVALECFHAGADDVIHPNGKDSAVLRAKLHTLFSFKSTTDQLRVANHRLHQMSLTDDLTGLANMRGFGREFASTLQECRAGKTGLGIMMMDLDHFKSVNDKNNHLVGSHIIRSVGFLLKDASLTIAGDVCARYGGDEYIALLRDGTPEEIFARADNIRKAIEQYEFSYDQIKIRITASVGVAYAPAGFDGKAEDIIKAADMMLYRSKDQGRNCSHSINLKAALDSQARSKKPHLVVVPSTGDEAASMLQALGERRKKTS